MSGTTASERIVPIGTKPGVKSTGNFQVPFKTRIVFPDIE
jgi:hypothetical protein